MSGKIKVEMGSGWDERVNLFLFQLRWTMMTVTTNSDGKLERENG